MNQQNEIQNRNQDLGIIVEEDHSTTYSKIISYNQTLQRGLTMMHQNSLNQDKNYLQQNSNTNSKPPIYQEKVMNPIPNENDEVGDIKNNFKILKPSNTVLREMSDELSNITDSELIHAYSHKSSAKSQLKDTIDHISKNTRQLYPIVGFKKNKDKSELKSISSIMGDSINYVNPEEKKGNLGMIEDQLNSARRSGIY